MASNSQRRRMASLIHLLVIRPLLKLVFGVSIEGRENLAGLERFILVANHNSHLDVFLLFQLLSRRQLCRTRPVAAYEYFSKSKLIFRIVSFLFEPVWVDRTRAGRDPLKGMRECLEQGDNLVIFPEGSRGEAGEIAPFKAGVGRLAESFPDIPVVPAFLSGPERAFPRASSFPIPLWNRIIVGPPMHLSGAAKEIAANLEAMTRGLAESEVASRHRRARQPRAISTLAVLGIDGSGKSSLARGLAERLSGSARVCLITDDIAFYEDGVRRDIQLLLKERLREAIGRRAKTAGSLKSYKIPKLAELLLRDRIVEEVRCWYAPDVIVMDGAPLLNIAAWANIYRGEDFSRSLCAALLCILTGRENEVESPGAVYEAFPELTALRRAHLAQLVLPDALLFLDVDPSVSMERIRSRGEEQQVHETEEKLAQLRQGYQLVCEAVQGDLGVPARILDGHQEFEAVLAAAICELGRIAEEELEGLRQVLTEDPRLDTPGADP